MINVVLVEPDIAANTGNVARLCAATKCVLHLVGPMGFELSDRMLKRAGMDYWKLVDYKLWENWAEFQKEIEERRYFFLSSKAKKTIYEEKFCKGDYLIFGRETKGLPESLLRKNPEKCLTIPMPNPDARCLNLATSVSVAAYEALRQLGKL
ncbi:MAG: tRNA (cytidine(34)-2'-O)-methyltransferase [Verrucomicrobiota bacterium]